MTQHDKVAVVTGASRGIGQAIAVKLGRLGYTVAGTATTDAGAASIAAVLGEHSINGSGYTLNVCDIESIKDFFSAIAADFSAPTILVNNAGITQDNIFLRMKPEQWDSVIDTNLSSVYRMTKAGLKPMIKSRWGRVINITSVVGQTGNPGQANYCASKAGIIGFTKSLALELAQYGITFNAVAPGFIETRMTTELTDDQKQVILSRIPMNKMGLPQDIANAVAFLASDDSSYITGQTLHINGGMYLP
jgi:3-oxoacyl-[acyl-carrier protein] reductase